MRTTLCLVAVFLCACLAFNPPPITRDALLLSFSAYCGDAVAQNFSCYWCKQLSGSFSVIGTFGDASSSGFGFVGIYNGSLSKQIVVSWRGTDDISGFIQDGKFLQTNLPEAAAGVEVHEGFLEICNSLRSSVSSLFLSARSQCPSCPVLFTGHSLGASLCTLGTVLLANDVGSKALFPAQILNFGSPRLFNPFGAKWFQSNLASLGLVSHIRITSMNDPVPHLPPQNVLGIHYQHGPQEMWQTSQSPLQFKVCAADNGEDPTCSDSVPWYKLNVLDHAQYVGFNALDGVPHGCLYTDKKK